MKEYTSLRLQKSTADELAKLKTPKESDDAVLLRLIALANLVRKYGDLVEKAGIELKK